MRYRDILDYDIDIPAGDVPTADPQAAPCSRWWKTPSTTASSTGAGEGMVRVTAREQDGRMEPSVDRQRRGHDARAPRAGAGKPCAAKRPRRRGRGCYGLFNVNKRIQLYYNQPEGLRIESGESGTTVTLRVPFGRDGRCTRYFWRTTRLWCGRASAATSPGSRRISPLVGEAPDGEMALAMLQDIKPDILITDIRMPFMDGLELCRALRRDHAVDVHRHHIRVRRFRLRPGGHLHRREGVPVKARQRAGTANRCCPASPTASALKNASRQTCASTGTSWRPPPSF